MRKLNNYEKFFSYVPPHMNSDTYKEKSNALNALIKLAASGGCSREDILEFFILVAEVTYLDTVVCEKENERLKKRNTELESEMSDLKNKFFDKMTSVV